MGGKTPIQDTERERERERERRGGGGEGDTSASADQNLVFSESPDGNIIYNLLPLKVGRPKCSRTQNLDSYKNQGILSDDEKKKMTHYILIVSVTIRGTKQVAKETK